jgi:hypothetical protein
MKRIYLLAPAILALILLSSLCSVSDVGRAGTTNGVGTGPGNVGKATVAFKPFSYSFKAYGHRVAATVLAPEDFFLMVDGKKYSAKLSTPPRIPPGNRPMPRRLEVRVGSWPAGKTSETVLYFLRGRSPVDAYSLFVTNTTGEPVDDLYIGVTHHEIIPDAEWARMSKETTAGKSVGRLKEAGPGVELPYTFAYQRRAGVWCYNVEQRSSSRRMPELFREVVSNFIEGKDK